MKPTVIVVTGASQGIGEAIARAFAESVPSVGLALVARNERGLRRVAAACRKLGAAADVFPCDVTDEGAVAGLADAVKACLGTPSVLVNNAGKFEAAPFLTTSAAQFDRMVAGNLRSVFLVSKAFIPGMIRRGGGDIFNLSSVAGLAGYPGGSAYCAAKFGVTGLSKVMRAELRGKRIRVCCVHPGATATPSWDGSGVSPKRMMPASDVAAAIVAAWRMGPRTSVEEIVLRPRLGDV